MAKIIMGEDVDCSLRCQHNQKAESCCCRMDNPWPQDVNEGLCFKQGRCARVPPDEIIFHANEHPITLPEEGRVPIFLKMSVLQNLYSIIASSIFLASIEKPPQDLLT
ncbi:MAG: hypothetical protein AB1488_05335 [Nitrospirota bacterium]